MTDPRLIVGTPEWIAAQKKRPIKYKACADCSKRTNQEEMVLIYNNYWVCGPCARVYRAS